jgi:hypothetical protein
MSARLPPLREYRYEIPAVGGVRQLLVLSADNNTARHLLRAWGTAYGVTLGDLRELAANVFFANEQPFLDSPQSGVFIIPPDPSPRIDLSSVQPLFEKKTPKQSPPKQHLPPQVPWPQSPPKPEARTPFRFPQFTVARLQLTTIWFVVAVIVLVLVHPYYEAQIHGSSWEDAPELNQSAWMWSPPEVTYGFRYRPDRGRQFIYCLATLILGAGVLATVRLRSTPAAE